MNKFWPGFFCWKSKFFLAKTFLTKFSTKFQLISLFDHNSNSNFNCSRKFSTFGQNFILVTNNFLTKFSNKFQPISIVDTYVKKYFWSVFHKYLNFSQKSSFLQEYLFFLFNILPFDQKKSNFRQYLSFDQTWPLWTIGQWFVGTVVKWLQENYSKYMLY